MKKFKVIDNKFICEKCGKDYKLKKNLSRHISLVHNPQNYYDSFLNDEDIKCSICKKQKRKFISVGKGYFKTCGNKKCVKKSRDLNIKKKWNDISNDKTRMDKIIKKRIKTSQQKYNVDFPTQTEDFKKRAKESNILNHSGYFSAATPECIKKAKATKKSLYNDENYCNSKKIAETKEKRYGNKNYTNREKAGKTNFKKYGNISPLWGKDQIIKKKFTWIKKYGVDNPLKNPDIFKKNLKARYKIKKFKNTDLWYQGSFELDFLENFYELLDIARGPSIPYFLENKNRIYHSDFYIKSLNLVVEIKNQYLYESHYNEIMEKEKATIITGFNYIIIINKDYTTFFKILEKNGIKKN